MMLDSERNRQFQFVVMLLVRAEREFHNLVDGQMVILTGSGICISLVTESPHSSAAYFIQAFVV